MPAALGLASHVAATSFGSTAPGYAAPGANDPQAMHGGRSASARSKDGRRAPYLQWRPTTLSPDPTTACVPWWFRSADGGRNDPQIQRRLTGENWSTPCSLLLVENEKLGFVPLGQAARCKDWGGAPEGELGPRWGASGELGRDGSEGVPARRRAAASRSCTGGRAGSLV